MGASFKNFLDHCIYACVVFGYLDDSLAYFYHKAWIKEIGYELNLRITESTIFLKKTKKKQICFRTSLVELTQKSLVPSQLFCVCFDCGFTAVCTGGTEGGVFFPSDLCCWFFS